MQGAPVSNAMIRRWCATQCALVFAVLLACVASWMAISKVPNVAATGKEDAVRAAQIDDRVLYEHIVERVQSGESYYPAAATELRQHAYPLKPVMAFRLPTLAWIEASLPDSVARMAVLTFLAMGAIVLWLHALADATVSNRMAIVVALGSGLANVGAVGSVYLHETWSIVFQVAALAMMRKSAAATGMLALMALSIRETALPFAVCLSAVAWISGYRRTSLAVVGCMVLFGLAYAAHMRAVSEVVGPGDPVSQGWLGQQGWLLVVRAAQWNLLFAAMSLPMVALLLPAVLSALAVVRRAEEVVGALTAVGFAVALNVVGRTDNYYWGIMASPYLLLGVATVIAQVFEKAIQATLPVRR